MTFSFCISLSYGFIVTIVGLIGFLIKRNSISLLYLAFGGISFALGYQAFEKYYTNVSDKNEMLGGLVISAILSIVMCYRWLMSKSGKFMPVLSVLMSVFYVYRLLNPNLPRDIPSFGSEQF
eukprot:225065_1